MGVIEKPILLKLQLSKGFASEMVPKAKNRRAKKLNIALEGCRVLTPIRHFSVRQIMSSGMANIKNGAFR